VEELFPAVTDAAGKFVRGKGEAELAKAAAIKARAISAIVRLEYESRRLIQEREAEERAAENQRIQDEMTHNERLYRLKTERLKAVVDSLEKLRVLGAEVNIDVFVAKLIESLDE
jgi:hypothetical protein